MAQKGQRVELGDVIGGVAPANTLENGWWPESHLHFAIYIGLWEGKVLPGYYRRDQKLTKLRWRKNPSSWVRNYKV